MDIQTDVFPVAHRSPHIRHPRFEKCRLAQTYRIGTTVSRESRTTPLVSPAPRVTIACRLKRSIIDEGSKSRVLSNGG